MKLYFRIFVMAGIILVPFITPMASLASPNADKEDSLLITDWIHYDIEDDGIAGASINKAYQLLAGRPSKTVLVAVIDSGFDLDHVDMQNSYWINMDEIPDNGKDDDKNGYVDDVYGWNFIGGKDDNVIYDSYEVTREYKRLYARYGDVEEGSGSEFDYWLNVKDTYESKLMRAEMSYNLYKKYTENIPRYYKLLESYLDTDSLKYEEVAAIDSEDDIIEEARSIIAKMLKYIGDGASPDLMVKLLGMSVQNYEYEVNYGYNLDFDPRAIVGDDYDNKKERYYGNNQTNEFSGAMGGHGTHVAGIIAANRNNHTGARGIADNVKIIPLRTIPNGDERDKDVANAIYYAVDNGARVINMSFGKHFSPDRSVVEKAIRYAEKKGVLIVHAAGNDAEDKDIIENFPTRQYIRGNRIAQNMIEVAASSKELEETLPAKFTSYGMTGVDLFAPGVLVYSTMPDNSYKASSGTSMAAPVVSGVAALLMSYFPDLSAKEIKEVLLQSTSKYEGDVYLPGTRDEVPFSDLSATGGIINAYEAVKIAQNMQRMPIR